MSLDSPEMIIDFLRTIGPLDSLQEALRKETGDSANVKLPTDAFELWETHFTHYGQGAMAKRIRATEKALHSLVEAGIPDIKPPVRVLDHGICGGLLLLKFSTLWFKLIFACKNATPKSGTYEEKVRDRLVTVHRLGT